MTLDDDQNPMTPDPLVEDYTAPDTPFPWMWVIIGGTAVLVVIIAFIVLIVTRRNTSQAQTNPTVAATNISIAPLITSTPTLVPGQEPDVVLSTFYTALAKGDNAEAASYLDPRSQGLDPRMTMMETVRNVLGFIIGSDQEVKLDFQNLSFDVVSIEGDKAQVRVVGDLILVAPGSALDQKKFIWAYTHQMVRIQGKWFLVL